MGRGVLILAAALCSAPLLSWTRQTAQSVPLEAQVTATCGTCHALPPPDVLPRSAGPADAARIMYLREDRLPPTGRNAPPPALPPDMQQALAYYLARAPERLPAAEPWPGPDES